MCLKICFVLWSFSSKQPYKGKFWGSSRKQRNKKKKSSFKNMHMERTD